MVCLPKNWPIGKQISARTAFIGYFRYFWFNVVYDSFFFQAHVSILRQKYWCWLFLISYIQCNYLNESPCIIHYNQKVNSSLVCQYSINRLRVRLYIFLPLFSNNFQLFFSVLTKARQYCGYGHCYGKFTPMPGRAKNIMLKLIVPCRLQKRLRPEQS